MYKKAKTGICGPDKEERLDKIQRDKMMSIVQEKILD